VTSLAGAKRLSPRDYSRWPLTKPLLLHGKKTGPGFTERGLLDRIAVVRDQPKAFVDPSVAASGHGPRTHPRATGGKGNEGCEPVPKTECSRPRQKTLPGERTHDRGPRPAAMKS
jgi:hypothetical protein